MIPRIKLGLNNGRPVIVQSEDRFLNLLSVGKPGTGKSALLANFWNTDCLFRNSKILIDPSGNLSKQAYSINKGRGYYCSLEHPVSINPLTLPFGRHQIVDNVIEIINQYVLRVTANQELTSRMHERLSEAILWCLKNNRRNFQAIADYLSTRSKKDEATEGILNRLNLFLRDEQFSKIINDENAIDWAELIKKGETFILDCFGMSRAKMILAGTIITHSIKSYFRYTYVKEYKPLLLYVDEAYNFVNENWFDVLKEGRKYKISAILATQDFATIDETLVRVMLSTIGTLVSFRVGYREAHYLSREFPSLTTEQLQFLEKYHIAYRTPEDEGIAKTSRPPIIEDIPIKAGERSKEKFKLKWFPLEPLNSTEPCPAADNLYPHRKGRC